MSENDFFKNNEIFAKKIGKILKEDESVSPHVEARLKAARLLALSMMKKEEEHSVLDKLFGLLSFRTVSVGVLAMSFLFFGVGSVLLKAETESVFNHNLGQVLVHLQDDVQQENDMINMIEVLGEEI
jgi:hypothetical protein